MKVWHVHGGGQWLHDLREHTHVVETVAFAPDSAQRTLAAAAGAGSSFSSMSASKAPQANGTARGPRGLGDESNGPYGGGVVAGGEDDGVVSAARRFVASGSRDKTVKLWNATVGHCLMTFVSFSPGSPWFYFY